MSYRNADCVGYLSWIQRGLRQMRFHELLNPREQFGAVAGIFTSSLRMTDASGQDFQISLNGGSPFFQRQHRGFLVKRGRKTEQSHPESGYA